MLTTPEEIDKKQFKVTRIKEGYDQDEVDDFLDRVAADYRKLKSERDQVLADNQRLRDRAANTQPTQVIPVTPPTPVESAERLLRVAEQTAQEHIADAQQKADEIVREAGGKGARVVEEAQQAGSKIVEDARVEAARLLAGVNAEADQIRSRKVDMEAEVQQLTEKHRTIRSWLQSSLDKMNKEAASDG